MTPSKGQLALKRALDVVLSGVALLILSPLFLGLALFIKFRSPGPVFFRQSRVGLGGEDLLLLKFRSMHSNAAALPNAATTRRADPRVFPGGEAIRKYKLDELPQIVNVLLGDMSLVGPRPTVREDYERMTDEQRRRVSVRPGLSGLAQISGNTALSWPQRIVLDLEYIDDLSVWNDIKIIVRTFGLIVSGRADTHPASDDEWS
ncbi:MAG: sugar transferase [Alphaproteobacteria bacterium]|nr:sugar transferase [Alphaproteobacteria bacterium]